MGPYGPIGAPARAAPPYIYRDRARYLPLTTPTYSGDRCGVPTRPLAAAGACFVLQEWGGGSDSQIRAESEPKSRRYRMGPDYHY